MNVRAWRRAALVTGVGAGLVTGLAMAAGVFWLGSTGVRFARLAARLPAERRLARAAGLPLNPDELNRTPPVPAAENAAPYYLTITRRLARRRLRDQRFPVDRAIALGSAGSEAGLTALSLKPFFDNAKRRGAVTASDRSLARSVVARFATEIRLAERASTLPACDFQRDWEHMAGASLPESPAFGLVTDLLFARSWLENDAGHPRTALRTLEVAARISRQAGSDPTFIAMATRIYLESDVEMAWYHVVKTHADRPDVLALAAQVADEFGPAPDLREALRGDAAQGEAFLDQVRSAIDAGAESHRHSSWFVQTLADSGAELQLEFLLRALAILSGTPGRNTIEEYWALRRLDDQEQQRMARDKLAGLLTMVDVPEVSYEDLRALRAVAMRRLHRTMLAVLRYRLRAGRFPASLSAVCAQAPHSARGPAADSGPIDCIDPFSGHPLHYRRTRAGFVLYSVGEDLRDDGGQIRPQGSQPALDIGVAYP